MKSNYTKSQREKIYRKAARLIDQGKSLKGFVTKDYFKNYPEMQLWQTNFDQRLTENERVMGLLLAAEMCK